MKKAFKRFLVLSSLTFLPLVFIFLILMTAVVGNNTSSKVISGGKIVITAEELAEKADISVARAEDVIRIANWQLEKENFSIAGTSGSLAVAERESGFDPKAVNPSGGVAGYYQWSGWDNQINGNRWAAALSRTLTPEVELQLMSTELNGNWKHVKEAMQTATDPKEAAKIWSRDYEGVSLSDGQTKLTELQADAQKWYDILNGAIETTGSVAAGDGQTLASAFDFPTEYKGKLKYGQPTQKALTSQLGSGYPAGQCTWYVYNRLMEVGTISPSDGYGYLGNGQDWVGSLVARGWKQVTKAQVGAVVSQRYGEYGHVMFVEHVNSDGSFLISECNYANVQDRVHYRVLTHAPNMTYAVRK